MPNEKETLKHYRSELRRLRLKILRLNAHLEVLVNTPDCNTAKKLRDNYQAADFSDSILHYN